MKWRYALIAVLTTLLITTFTISSQPLLANNSSVATASDLVAAINSANSNPDADTIILISDITLDAIAESSTTYGNSGLPAITSDITIEGQGHWLFWGGPNFRFLRIASTGTLTLYNLSLGAGHATAGTTAGGCGSGISCGGGIFSEGT
ncbi:MAG: hypothetical protein ABI970_19790, partial [Chloroflexota bacterium]